MFSPLHWHPGGCVPCEAFAPSRTFLRTHSGRVLLVEALLLSLVCASCGTVGSNAPADPPPAAVTISVSPSAAQIFLGQSMTVTAAVQNAASPELNWEVQATSGGNSTYGTIVSTGSATATYTAPASGQTPQTVTITAVLQSDSTKFGSATITIDAITGPLRVSPAVTSITTSQASQAIQFQVLTPGVTANDVSWQSSGGTITPGGLFSPPNVPGIYTIVASIPSTSGSATVAETDFPGTFTWRNDNMRSGINSQELALTPATVTSSSFGLLFRCAVDGPINAQPLYVPNLLMSDNLIHDVVIVATGKGSIFAFDGDTGKQLWVQNQLIPSDSTATSLAENGSVFFEGITGTPAIDRTNSAMYLVLATTQSTNPSAQFLPVYSHTLYSIDITTGQLKQPGTAIVSAAPPFPAFNSDGQLQRAALLLDNGRVYVAFGSDGSLNEYHGWLLAYDAASLQLTGSFDVTPQALQGGIWQGGGGPSSDPSDPSHYVFVETGDGPYDVNRGGMSYSDSFLKFNPAPQLSVSSYFTPFDQATLSNAGQNGGTTAPLLLPDSTFSGQPHLLIGGSKNGCLYLLNRDEMEELGSSCPSSPVTASVDCPSAGEILSTPIFWNNTVFVAPACGSLLSISVTSTEWDPLESTCRHASLSIL